MLYFTPVPSKVNKINMFAVLTELILPGTDDQQETKIPTLTLFLICYGNTTSKERYSDTLLYEQKIIENEGRKPELLF